VFDGLDPVLEGALFPLESLELSLEFSAAVATRLAALAVVVAASVIYFNH
jgi:hypothetical protein